MEPSRESVARQLELADEALGDARYLLQDNRLMGGGESDILRDVLLDECRDEVRDSRRCHGYRDNMPQFAVCIKNTGYPASLELHKMYRVIADEDAARDGDIRIVDESGEDYLYPADWFVVVELPQAVQESILRAA